MANSEIIGAGQDTALSVGMRRMGKRSIKMTAWEHVKAAHEHLLIAYSMVDATQFYADTINRALRNAALSMGQMPVQLSKINEIIAALNKEESANNSLQQLKFDMAAPKTCRRCPIDEMCDGYDRCVWPVYAAGIKEARPTKNKGCHAVHENRRRKNGRGSCLQYAGERSKATP